MSGQGHTGPGVCWAWATCGQEACPPSPPVPWAGKFT